MEKNSALGLASRIRNTYRRLRSSSDFLQEILALLLPVFLLVLHLLPLILSRLPASTVIPNSETYPLLEQEKLADVLYKGELSK